MAGFRLITGNRLETLAEHLACSLADAPSPPLTPEIIVVQNPDMGRWLTTILSAEQGICANVRFPLPNSFIREILSLITGGDTAESCFRTEVLLWNIMARLPELSAKEVGAPIRPYLAAGNSRKAYHLARSLASLFDRYSVFRPEFLLSWEQKKTVTSNPNEPWQAALWREIGEQCSASTPAGRHHASLIQEARGHLLSRNPLPHRFPSRLNLFAISSLPPAHADILAGLSRQCDITLYILNFCQEYWEDIVSDRDISRLQRDSPPGELYLSRGNPLLAALGRLHKDFLASCRSYDPAEEELFISPAGNHLLASIQKDILELVDRPGAPDSQCDPLTVDPNDTSIQVHLCHSRLREIEVLHDHILHLLNDTPDLSPGDIRVCAPDLKEYIPLVRAVFEVGNQHTFVPYTIIDPLRKSGSLTETFLALLDLTESRITAGQVLEIIGTQPVRRCFGLSENDLFQVRQMIEKAGIRWGMDGEDRQRQGLPLFGENSWQAGIDRLLLGYAMHSGNTDLYREILPVDTTLGESTELLGTFLECVSTLFNCIRTNRIPCSAEEWSDRLLATLDRCLTPDDDEEEEYLHIRRILRGLSLHSGQALYTANLESGTIRDHLRLSLESENQRSSSPGFLSGGVHFCTLTEARSIPCRVICLIGMNDLEFPRPAQEMSFDLMAAHPRPGDRSIRIDDRAIFLETLVSARDQLYISYIGRSAIDDTMLSPSVLVSDLLDIIDQGYLRKGHHNGSNPPRLLTIHSLQPFHPCYFRGSAVNFKSSFSRENCLAARSLMSDRVAPLPFLHRPLPQPPDSLRHTDILTLSTFFLNPIRFLCTERLNIRIRPRPDVPAEDEPFVVTGLERYRLENEILRHHRAGHDSESLFLARKAAGDLPVGQTGKTLFHRTWNDIEKLEKRLAALDPGPVLPPMPVHLIFPPFTISGIIDAAYSNGLVRLRCASVKAGDRIRAWILHLIHGAAVGNHQETGRTMLLGKDRTYIFHPVKDPEAELRKMLTLYWQGLTGPISLFAETSLAFALSRFEKKTEEESLNRARDVWNGSSFRTGECEDPYYRIAFRNRDPLDTDFMRTAETLFLPLLDHQEQIS